MKKLAEWREYEVSDVISKVIDYRGKTPKKLGSDWSDSGYRALSAKNIKTGKIVQTDSIRYVSEELYKKWMIEEVFEEDILITSEAPLGQIYFWDSTEKIVLSQRLFAVRVNEMFYPKYIFFYMMSQFFQDELNSRATGTTVLGIRQTELLKCKIFAPSYQEQKRIADLLWCIEQKIKSNEEINNNLEQQAMALFKSWFIDYEPYNRAVPNNWVEYKLSDFLPVITGKKNANISSSIGTYPFFSCSQDITWTDEYSFEGNAILVAGNGDFNVKFYNGKFEAYQRTYVLIPHNPRFSAWLFYAVKYNLNKITAAARGSVIKFITKGNLEDFSFYAPLNLDDFDVIDQFTAINDIIASNREEIICLSDIRDTLLPKLMSSGLDVSDIDL